MNTIYVYSTPTYQEKKLFKVGQTSRTAEERVKEQDGTSNPEQLVLLDHWSSKVTDHELHKMLEDLGFHRPRHGREWFELPNGVEDVKLAYNNILHGVARPNSYPMRREQQECCDKAVAHFNDGGKKFLINAKPRFGKVFTSYQIVKAMNFQRVLVLSYKPQVFDSWNTDLEKHVDFDGWLSIRASREKPTGKTDTFIVVESFQQLLNKTGTLKKNSKSDWIYSEHWDLVILDEEHYGTKTDNAKNVIEKLSYNHSMSLSGTPYKSLANGEYQDDEIYSWTYIDEQKRKKEGSKAHQSLPTMRFHTFNVHPDIVNEAAACGYTGEDAFRIEKVFAANAKGFENSGLVDLFLKTLRTKRSKGESWSPYMANNIDNRLMDHMLWMLPLSVDSVTALCRMLERHPDWSDYEIINASGNNIDDIAIVKRTIKNNNKTITVSCGRFDTGVTVPQWKTVMMLDGSKSPEKYIQTIFRAQSPYIEHDECLVIDFNPQRLLEMTYDYCSVMSLGVSSTQQVLREFFEVASIMEHGENGIHEHDVEAVMAAFNSSGQWQHRFASNMGINMVAISADVVRGLEDVRAATARSIAKLIGDDSLEKGKIAKLTKKQKKEAKKREDEIKRIRAKAQQVLRRIPTYLLASTNGEENCQNIIETGDKEKFKGITGVSIQWFDGCLTEGFFKRPHLDRCISDFAHLEQQISLDAFLS